MAVAVKSSATGFEAGAPKLLFEQQALRGEGPYYTYDVTGDGQRFLLAVPPGGSGADPIHVVTNWPAALKK